ncbi:MAG: glycoside hydrolase family 1 protein [Microthrixaceae bacterium]
MTTLRFPDGFEWSTATAAHQIEGGNTNNDWWVWEHTEDAPTTESSGDACDSWQRWERDVDLVRDLGVGSYRFSVEWSRLEPAPGEWSHATADHYARLCEALLEVGVSPTVTLHHFTTPRWLAEQGGLTSESFPERFEGFTERIATRLSGLVPRFCTLNEPNIVAGMGYIMGLFPPGVANDMDAYDTAATNMIAAHRGAVAAVRRVAPDAQVGLTVNLADNQALEGGEAQAAEADAMEDAFVEAADGDDFVGVQVYTRMVMGPEGWVGPQPGVPVIEEMGYEFWPEALGACVRRVWDRLGGRVPIIVTENGTAANSGDDRIRYVERALTSLHGCIDDGIDVRGYTYWSLLDNFEWAMGYEPKFGLVAIDRDTFAATPKPAFRWFADVVSNNAVEVAHE